MQVFVVNDVETNKKYACKKMSCRSITEGGYQEMVIREIEIMKSLKSHSSVSQIVDVFEDKSHIFIVMDLCDNGDLLKNIVKVLKQKGK